MFHIFEWEYENKGLGSKNSFTLFFKNIDFIRINKEGILAGESQSRSYVI